MPGNRLNDTERALQKKWNSHGNYSLALKSISVNGTPGIRGIQKLNLEFQYPLTAIAGRNGTGKTTLLAIAALGFHAPDNHFSRGSKIRATQSKNKNNSQSVKNYSALTFSDFFYKGPNDPDISGVNISWKYQNGKELSITKSSNKWMHYERRQIRPVHYLGISRTLPAIEQSILKFRFSPRKKSNHNTGLNAEYVKRLNEIMGREYSAASELSSDSYKIRTCSTKFQYSSFNMGAGEDVIIDILTTLQNCPDNSLIVIEEIELGIHPEALRRLAKHIQEIILEKKSLQVIVSTHSKDFLESIPSQARVLLQSGTEEHYVTYAPTTEFAMGNLTGILEPELFIYCEDDFAEKIINTALRTEQRKRCKIIPIGSKGELAKQALMHLRVGLKQSHLIVWDGDVQETEVQSWLNGDHENADKVHFTFFTDSLPPERSIIHILDCTNGYTVVKDALDFNNEVESQQLIQRLKTLTDHHEIPYQASAAVNLDEKEVCHRLVASAKKVDEISFQYIAKVVDARLEGADIRGRNVTL